LRLPLMSNVRPRKAMSSPRIAAVMIHVSSISEAMAWYERVFPNAQRSSTEDEEFEFL